ncbi:MAG: hypothetical protein C4346_20075 [Chloroflexota bacterium]
MRRIAIILTVVTVGLMLAFSIRSGVEALSSAGSHRDTTASFSKKDDDKEKESDHGNESASEGKQDRGNTEDHPGGDNSATEPSDDETDPSDANGNSQSHDTTDNGVSSDNRPASGDNGESATNDEQSDDRDHSSTDKGEKKDKKRTAPNMADDEGAAQDDSGDKNDKPKTKRAASTIRVCHVTGREDFPYNLIEISESAVPAHEEHGDFLAPEDADSSSDCEEVAAVGTPIASPEASPVASPIASPVPLKVRICHVTSSETDPVILIEVSEDALPAHEEHGDVVAPDDADSSNDCEQVIGGTPVASPEASPVASPEAGSGG